jgi:hypothetical protein
MERGSSSSRSIFSILIIISVIAISIIPQQARAQQQEFFGRVTHVEQYALANFNGCHAIVRLENPLKDVAVLSSDNGICNTLTTAVQSGIRIAFFGERNTAPPIIRPGSGPWTVDVYNIDIVILPP